HSPWVGRRDARTDMRHTSQGTPKSGSAASPPVASKARSKPRSVSPRLDTSRPLDRHADAPDRNRDAGGTVRTHPRGKSPDDFTSARPTGRRESPDRKIGATSKTQARGDRLVRHQQPSRNRV